MNLDVLESVLQRVETMAAELVTRTRAGEWEEARDLDVEVHAALSRALASVDATDASARRHLVASLERIQLGYDEAERAVAAARARLAAERTDWQHARRHIGRYLETAAG